jgi:hypothetical protein
MTISVRGIDLRKSIPGVLLGLGLGSFLVVEALRGPDSFPMAAFVGTGIMFGLVTYDRAKRDGTSEPGSAAIVVFTKAIGIGFLAWVFVVELHGPLSTIDVARDAEPSLTGVGFLAIATAMLVAAPTRRVRIRVGLWLLTIALLGLAVIAWTSGFGDRVSIALVALACASAASGYLLARRDRSLE